MALSLICKSILNVRRLSLTTTTTTITMVITIMPCTVLALTVLTMENQYFSASLLMQLAQQRPLMTFSTVHMELHFRILRLLSLMGGVFLARIKTMTMITITTTAMFTLRLVNPVRKYMTWQESVKRTWQRLLPTPTPSRVPTCTVFFPVLNDSKKPTINIRVEIPQRHLLGFGSRPPVASPTMCTH